MKHILKITSALLFSLIVLGCSSDNEALEEFNSLSKTSKEVKKLKEIPNPNLDFKLHSLKDGDLSSEDNVSKVIAFLEEGTNNYYKKVLQHKNLAYNEVKPPFEQVTNELNRYEESSSNNKNISPIKQLLEGNEDYFNEDQKRLLKQCDDALASFDGTNSTSVINAFEDIRRTARAELSGEKAQIILIASKVGIMTSRYWNENLNEWNEMLTDISDSKKAGENKIVSLDETTN